MNVEYAKSKDLVSEEIICFLRSQRMSVHAAWLLDRPELCIKNGHTVVVGRSEITFKLLDAESLLIVLYKIDKENRRSLGFSLRELIKFVHLLGDNIPSLKKAVGVVDVYPYRSCKGIKADRLAKMYVRFGAKVFDSNGQKWVEYRLK